MGQVIFNTGTFIESGIVMVAGSGGVATDYEDIQSFTKVDSAGDIELFPLKVSFDTVQKVANSYVYKDYGEGYFGDFIIEYEMEITDADSGGLCHNLAVTNTVPGTVGDLSTANDALFQFSYGNSGNLRITVKDYSTDLSDDYYDGGTSSAHLYCRLSRASTTLTLEIYSDSARETLIDTLTCGCETETKRYLYVFGSWDTVGTDTISGYTQNVNIIAPEP